MWKVVSFVVVGILVSSVVVTAEGAIKKDLYPDSDGSLGLWHISNFTVSTNLFLGEVAKTHTFTMIWDNFESGALLSVIDPAEESILVLSAGNDRKVTAKVSLLAGSYQLVIVGLIQPTHYHLSATADGDVVLLDPTTTETTTEAFSAARAATALRIEELFAPRVAALEAALRR